MSMRVFCLIQKICYELTILGVPVAVGNSLLKRLEAEGFVTSGGKAKRYSGFSFNFEFIL